MSTVRKVVATERAEAITKLREMLPPGSTAYTILRHVSRSGMNRSISVVVQTPEGPEVVDWMVRRVLGLRFDNIHSGLKVSGCGMDMGFHLVYNLSAALYPDGFGCIGQGCPSNDHSNGDRDYTPHGGVKACGSAFPCTCHDDTAWDRGMYPNGCGYCGCHRAHHWHQDGGYALRQRWL